MPANMSLGLSLVPRLSAQLFFAYFTTCEKKLGREPGNEARLGLQYARPTSTVLVTMGGV